VAVVFGAGYRKEAGVNFATQLGLQAGYAIANFTNYPSSSYNVMEGFAELDAPILKNSIVDAIDVSMAGRMTSYSTSGLVETWKLGATSQINQDLKLRTTWSVDIRSPSLTELFNPASINTGSSKDPKTGANGVPFPECDGQSEPQSRSGPHHLGRCGDYAALDRRFQHVVRLVFDQRHR